MRGYEPFEREVTSPSREELRALREITGYEPFERGVTSPSRDNRLRALRDATCYEPFERQHVTSPSRVCPLEEESGTFSAQPFPALRNVEFSLDVSKYLLRTAPPSHFADVTGRASTNLGPEHPLPRPL
jgi:hypothetical protein